MHLVEDGWKIPGRGKVFTDSGTYAPMTLIGDFDDALSHVWLFGHNPGLSELTERLSPQDAPEHLSTCAVASLQLEIGSWSAVAAGSGRLVAYLYPKQEPA